MAKPGLCAIPQLAGSEHRSAECTYDEIRLAVLNGLQSRGHEATLDQLRAALSEANGSES